MQLRTEERTDEHMYGEAIMMSQPALEWFSRPLLEGAGYLAG